MSLLARIASIGVLMALLLSCPKAQPAIDPAKGTLDDSQVRKLATILRAADRRTVDDELRALLVDPDARLRAKAAIALGQIGDPEGLAVLETRVADPDSRARSAIAFALGLIGAAESRASLELMAADSDPTVRAASAEALGKLRDVGSTPRIAASLEDPDASVRRAAALASWKFADPTTLLPGLLRALSADDARVRAASAYALARLTSAPIAPASSGAPVGRLSPDDLRRAREALATRVGDADAEVRRQVARGMASPQGASELAVVGTLSGDKDAGVRINAVRSLGYPGIAVKPYLERAMVDKDLAVARVALESIGKVCSGPALGLLQTHMYDYEASWLREALMTSFARCDPSMLPEIVDGLILNPDPVLRLAAAPLIAGRREPGALRAGYALAGDPDPLVQAAGIAYFADQDGPIVKLLGPRLEAPDPVVRAAVVAAIGARIETPRPDSEDRDTLLAILDAQWVAAEKDDIPDARLAVLDAAAKAPADDRVKLILERGLRDPEYIVRRRAAERLESRFDVNRRAEIGPSSDRPLADYEAIVRWAAIPHAAVITVQRFGTLPGRFSTRLDSEAAPMAAWNFSELAAKRFFDNRTVHRVVPNFVVQDGDPRGDGHGGPGYSIRDEYNPTTFDAGALGMASDGKDTAGSQWFVTLSMQPHLDGRYTAFGQVVQGQREIVQQVRPGDVVVSIRVYEGDGTEPLPAD